MGIFDNYLSPRFSGEETTIAAAANILDKAIPNEKLNSDLWMSAIESAVRLGELTTPDDFYYSHHEEVGADGSVSKYKTERGYHGNVRLCVQELRRWLDGKKQTYPDYLFGDSQAETVAGVSQSIGAPEQTITKAIQPNSNEFEFSGLLSNQPKAADDWFEVIDGVTAAFFKECRKMPTKLEAWTRLCTSPPADSGVKYDAVQGLTMIGVLRPLSKRSFGRRWDNYTRPS